MQIDNGMFDAAWDADDKAISRERLRWMPQAYESARAPSLGSLRKRLEKINMAVMERAKHHGYLRYSIPESLYAAVEELPTLIADIQALEQENGRLMAEAQLAEEVSLDIHRYVLQHIQVQYPDVWTALPNRTRLSIKGAIKNAWRFHIEQLDKKRKDLPHE